MAASDANVSLWDTLAIRVSELRTPCLIEDELRRRSIDRYRRVAFTAITSLGAKGITLITAVILVPISYRYLGAERYGLWMTITSFVLFLGFADMGIGNGLTARIAEADGTDKPDAIARLVSCAFYFLLPLSVLFFIIFAVLTHVINLSTLYGVRGALATREAGTATLVLLACSFVSMPLAIVQRVHIGFQRGFVADMWTACGSLLALGIVILVIHRGGGLPAMVFAIAGVPQIVMACNWIHQFFCARPNLRPRLRLFKPAIAFHLFTLGGLFFVQQCFGLIYYLSDNVVIARTMGAVQVAHYAVLQRIFSMGLVTQYVVTPLWPAIGEALARRDFAWASRTARRSICITFLIGTTCAIPLLFFSRYLVTRWSGLDPGPIDLLRVGFAIWVILVGYIATMNALLNQEFLMRRHLLVFGMASITSLVLKVLFARHGSLAGVIWGTNIAFGTLYVAPTLFFALKRLTPQVQGA